MTERMVSVPVEDLAGKLKAIRDKFLIPTPDKDYTDYAIMTRCIDALTAAPVREEGGAEDEGRLFAEVPLGAAALYRDLENGIRPILATREEAPAEAGHDPYDVEHGLAGVEGFGASYSREKGKWLLYSMPGAKPFGSVDGFDRASIDFVIDALRSHRTALRAQPVGWLRAVDEEMVCAHLGVADAEDSFETAKKKLASLIQWNIAVATDPSVGGHPAPDALRVAVEALAEARSELEAYERQLTGETYNNLKLNSALAALQAEQKGGA